MGFTAGVPGELLGWYSKRRHPERVVPPRFLHEVSERIDHAGAILVPLDEHAARRAVAELLDEGVEAIAVSLLWSFRNPAHEQRIGEIVREVAGDRVFLSLSSRVNPVIGEYERTATTVLNAYLGPIVEQYIERLEVKLREYGFRGALRILDSNGGVMNAVDAAARAVLLLSSGPTGGVLGSRYLAQALGHRDVITTDMGGTSFDVGLIQRGRPLLRHVTEVGGYHISAPMVQINAIGAGGGSIVTVEDGLICVGPESAGARPGPVCYGRGGTRATVTDANLVLGQLDPDGFLGGRMRLDREGAERAIDEQVARPLGLTPVEAAVGIRRIVDSHMAGLLRQLTIGRGHDPRDFVLYAYGGAGPVHCCSYGAELGVRQIVIPATSMVQSAYGALASDLHLSAERSFLLRGGGGARDLWDGLEAQAIEAPFASLEEECRDEMAREGIAAADVELRRSVDMRYRRQVHELVVPLSQARLTDEGVRELVGRFEETYEDTYGRGAGFREAGIEITTFRVDAVGRLPKPLLRSADSRGRINPAPPSGGDGGGRATQPVERRRDVWDSATGELVSTPLLRWASMQPGERIDGPAVIEHPTTTVVVPGDHRAEVDELGNLILQNGGPA
jgi:N-methylhydantoinase A